MRLSSAQIATEIGLAREAFARGNVADANHRIARVLQSNPESVDAHHGMAMILVGQGMHAEALSSIEQALRYDPRNSDLLAWAAITCLNLWDGARAEAFARRLVQIQPKNDRAHFLLSNALSLQGRLEDALESIEQSLGIRPAEPDYVGAKAQVLGRLKWSSQAIEWYRKALRLRPSPELSMELAEALIDEGQATESLAVLEQAAPQLPPESYPHELFAQAYTETQDFEKAAPHWSAAEMLTSDPAALALNRVNSEIYAGRLDVATELLDQALGQDPWAVQFYRPLTAIRKLTSSDLPMIETMEDLRSRGGLEPSLERDLCYALGKAHNDLGDYRSAMLCFDEANRIAYDLSPTCQKFDPNAWRAYTDRQIEFFTKQRVRDLAAQGLETEVPLFIVGMIRSGTTLTEQIVGRHSKVHAGGETTFWPDHRGDVFDATSQKFDTGTGKRLGQAFVRTLTRNAGGAKYATEKNPSNITIAALIHCIFPRAKLLHIKRHPVDNLLSMWMTPIRTGLPFIYHRENMVCAYREYLRLADHLAEVLPADRFGTFEYERITSDPDSTIADILSFLDLEPEPDCFHPERNSRTVRTPSFYQVRQPINTDSQEKWRHYEPWLSSFEELLV